VRVEGVSIGAVRVLSATDLGFALAAAANMTAARIRADNPDGSSITYYSYLRGVPAEISSRSLLLSTEPIFSGTSRTVATVGPVPATTGARYFAVALQNPTLNTAVVHVSLLASDGSVVYSSQRVLDTGHRLLLEASELLDGVSAPEGASLRITSSVPVEAFGLTCDESTSTVVPQLPIEAGS
jgi:hypothetical protein